MSERLSVVCTCGYETLVRPEQLGQTVECLMCGAELEVDEAAISGRRNVQDIQEGDEENVAPELPGVPDAQPAVDEPATTYEEAEEAVRSPRKYRSPFEDEEDEVADTLPPIEESQGDEGGDPHVSASAEPPQHAPSTQNPFEAGDDEHSEAREQRRGPFSLEAAPESAAGTSFAELVEGVRPKDRAQRNVVIPTDSPHDRPTGETCAECGRAIRGQWDRYETPNGIICYICSNQATDGVPLRMREERPEKRELTEHDLLIDKSQPKPPEPHRPWWKDPESDEFKRALFVLALLTLGFALYVFLFGGNEPSQVAAPAADSEPREYAPWQLVLMQVWTMISVVVSGFLACYIALSMNKRLPHESVFANVLYIGAVWVPLGVLYFLLAALAMFVGQLPVAGPIFSVLIPLARLLIIVLVVTKFLDLRFGELLTAGIIYFALRTIVFPAAGVLIFRIMGIV